MIHFGHAGDKKNVYYDGRRIEGADVNTFEVIEPCVFGYSKDKVSVYYEDKKIPGSDPKTFEILGENGYSKDKNNAYFGNFIINGADIKSFKALKGTRAEDKTNYYESGKISGKK